jgi:hypothetical protein
MSKVTISPMLNSLFSRTDRMTKDEANSLVEALSEVGGSDVRMSLCQSTVGRSQKANYVIVYGDNVVDDVDEVLKENGWNVTDYQNRGNSGKWFFFLRK